MLVLLPSLKSSDRLNRLVRHNSTKVIALFFAYVGLRPLRKVLIKIDTLQWIDEVLSLCQLSIFADYTRCKLM